MLERYFLPAELSTEQHRLTNRVHDERIVSGSRERSYFQSGAMAVAAKHACLRYRAFKQMKQVKKNIALVVITTV